MAAADGTAFRCYSDLPALHDPLTGAVTRLLPSFTDEIGGGQWWEDNTNPNGIVYGDGAVLLYNDPSLDAEGRFRVALLRPGKDDEDEDDQCQQWTLVERTLEGTVHS